MLATLLDVCGLARLFEDGFPLLHHCYDCWEALLRKRMPRLAAHIDGARDRPRLAGGVSGPKSGDVGGEAGNLG